MSTTSLTSLTRHPARPAGLLPRAAHDVRHGRIERSLSLLMSGGALATAAEIYLEHDCWRQP
ncbi:hypothetical protein AB0D08_40120 [Kitasatospora sp. NPDC048540]|uniref:hypothetical protein n=1 Tax=unclassified Kitasatospora TaxID=2633591 RepID=UPI00053A07AF|nr:hypothetical protein [Kitasatospora sp. MBT63]